MRPRLVFPDAETARDALTFAGRSVAVDAGASVRLVAAGGTLTMTTAILAPRSLLDPVPTVLALRALPVDPELECDVTVSASGVLATEDDSALELPSSAVREAWAGVSPPRSGWTRTGALAASVLAARAQWGMAAVAHALPAAPGEDIVRSVRAEVWGHADPELDDLVRGVAFAAVSMGFVRGEEDAAVFACAGWLRISLRRGHVLVRTPARSGLTAVRATG